MWTKKKTSYELEAGDEKRRKKEEKLLEILWL